MSVCQAILLGVIQGITEFLPVSSSGHLVLLQQVLNLEIENSLFFEAMLHIGTLLAVIAVFRADITRIFRELLHIFADIFDNIKIWFQNKSFQDEKRYHKLLSSNYRRFVILLLISTIPTGVIGYLIRGMVEEASGNLLAPAIGFFVTAILLLVTECAAEENEKSPHDTSFSEAAAIGIFQGFAAFPGVSRAGATLSACFICGFSRKYAMKYSYIMSIPAILGAAIMEFGGAKIGGNTVGIGIYLLAMMSAAAVGYFSIRFSLSMIRQKKLRYFSMYCMVIGILSIILHFTL